MGCLVTPDFREKSNMFSCSYNIREGFRRESRDNCFALEIEFKLFMNGTAHRYLCGPLARITKSCKMGKELESPLLTCQQVEVAKVLYDGVDIH